MSEEVQLGFLQDRVAMMLRLLHKEISKHRRAWAEQHSFLVSTLHYSRGEELIAKANAYLAEAKQIWWGSQFTRAALVPKGILKRQSKLRRAVRQLDAELKIKDAVKRLDGFEGEEYMR